MLLLSLVLYPFRQRLTKKIAALYATIFLLTMSVLRYCVGIDFFSYQDNYLIVSNGEFLNTEYGFLILSQICDYLGLGFQGVVASYATLTILLFISFYSRFSNNILLSIYIFAMMPILYLASFNVIRQFLAVAIFAYSIRFVFERKLILYVAFILFAAFFVHKSVLIMLPMYFLLSRNLNGRNYVVITSLYIISLQFIDFIMLKVGGSAIYLNGHFEDAGINSLVFIYFIMFIFITYIYFINKIFISSSIIR